MSEIQDFDQIYESANREINNLCDELDRIKKQLTQANAWIAELEEVIGIVRFYKKEVDMFMDGGYDRPHYEYWLAKQAIQDVLEALPEKGE